MNSSDHVSSYNGHGMRTIERNGARKSRRDRGVALILVLLVLSILIVVVVQFSYAVKVESRIVSNGLEDQQLTLAARGAAPYLAALFRDDRKNGKTPRDTDTLADCWNDSKLPDLLKTKCGEVELELRVEDLERRLSLEWLADDARHDMTFTALQRLLTKLAIDKPDELATKIRDKVRELAGKPAIQGAPGAGGTPAPAPQPQPAPSNPGDPGQQPRRAIFDLEELLAIEGYDDLPLAMYGDPKATPEPKVGFAGFVTCWPTTAINLNTASAQVLFAFLPNKNKEDKDLWAQADAVVAAIRTRRVDPLRETEGQQPGQPGQPAPAPTPAPTAEGQGAGASKGWSGKPFEKIDELQDGSINELLKSIFTKPDASGNPTPPSPTQPTTPQPGQPAQPIDFKTALTVESRLYAVMVKATASSGATKNVRMIVSRNKQDDVAVLLVREDPR